MSLSRVKITSQSRGRCPVCSRRIPVFEWHGRALFVHHTVEGLNRAGPTANNVPCEASGWLVEDEELAS